MHVQNQAGCRILYLNLVWITSNILKACMMVMTATWLMELWEKPSKVIILYLPSHTSHALQPLDLGVFSSLKKAWKQILKKWFWESRLQNVSESVFPPLFEQQFECLQAQNAIKSFLFSRLYPINIHEV